MLPAFTGAAGRLVLSLVAAVFAAAGAVTGAVLGLLSGFISDDGLMQGVLVGAITGALVSVELPDSVVRIWSYDDSSVDGWIKRTLFGLRSLPAGRFLGGSVFATIRSALDDQIDALQRHSGQGEQGGELFEPSSPVMAARRAAVDGLPVTEVSEFTIETARHQTTCPICLHDFQAGENVRMLPACCHVFHPVCIDSWLIWKSATPSTSKQGWC